MSVKNRFRLMETLAVGALGGAFFYFLNFPLPWVLGALTFVILWQAITKRTAYLPVLMKNTGFVILGLNFGMYFTMETFLTVRSYFFPYLLVTLLLISASIFLGILVTKWIHIDKVTSVFACIPGGLTEMTIASENLDGNPSFVAIFQTIRLLAVLFIIPAFMTAVFLPENAQTIAQREAEIIQAGNFPGYFWFVLPVFAGFLLNKRIPAGIIIGALGVTAAMNLSLIQLPRIPEFIVFAAQVMVGLGIGKNILFEDLKKAGKYGFIYLGLSVLIIAISFLLGLVLTLATSLDLRTALLSIAPGGLFEMVLTADSIGGDSAIVSSLQLIRILIIVMFVPSFLKMFFSRRKDGTMKHR